tara:strand:+ start:382 stop:783 length:402 start_codon:yes stop_codon:yes gene_type:complete
MDLYSINYLDLSVKDEINKVFFVKKRKYLNFLIAFLFVKNKFNDVEYPWQRTADKAGIISIALTNESTEYLMIKNFCYVKEIYTSFLRFRISKLNLLKRFLFVIIHLINPALIKIYVKMRIPQKNFETIDLQL